MARRLIAFLLIVFASVLPVRAQSTREVTYNPKSVVPISAKLRFTTLIVLPDGEEILDFICGDRDFWVVSGAQNLAYVKPAKAGATTNLNLVTATGRIYSFVLTEGGADPDLKVYVAPDETSAPGGVAPRLYSAGQVEAYRRETDEARQEARAAREDVAKVTASVQAAKEAAEKAADERVHAFRSSYPTTLEFSYRFKPNERPFFVSAIFHDGQFTYIRCDATELPSLYEVRDGSPNLVNFQVEHGTYVVPKVLERGYLTIGGHKFAFDITR